MMAEAIEVTEGQGGPIAKAIVRLSSAKTPTEPPSGVSALRVSILPQRSRLDEFFDRTLRPLHQCLWRNTRVSSEKELRRGKLR